MYVDAVNRGWFRVRPDKVRESWRNRGILLLLVGAALTFVLARWTHFGLLGIPVIVAALVMIDRAKHGCRPGPPTGPPCCGGSAGSAV